MINEKTVIKSKIMESATAQVSEMLRLGTKQMINEKTVIKSKIMESATAQVSEMLRQHFDQITGAAAAGFIYDEDSVEPNAKVGFSIEWDSLSTTPTVYVKIKYTTSYKDKSEAVVNSPQTELVLVEKGGAA